jgi:restriction endonuclease S subunit
VSGATMTRLRDLGDWRGGNTPPKANAAYWTDGTVPWVSPKDMKVDEITSSEDRVSEAALKEGRVSLVPAGSVLVVTRSGILSHTLPVAVTKTQVTINQDLKALTPKPDVSPKYVAHALRGASRRILRECSKHGTTVASVETSALLDFEIPLVDLDEQRRIVAELEKQFSRLDEAVANLQRVKANLRCKPEQGDLLYTKGGTTGIARINTESREFNVWVHVAVLKLTKFVQPFYVQHALNSQHCYRQAQQYTHGVGNQDLGLTRMVWITMPLPPLAEQHRIVAEVDRRLSIVREVESEVDANLKRAETLRQAVLARAFAPTGTTGAGQSEQAVAPA